MAEIPSLPPPKSPFVGLVGCFGGFFCLFVYFGLFSNTHKPTKVISQGTF